MERPIRGRLRYRLGLDLGSASMGWAILRLDADGAPDYLVRLGVRLFPSGRNQKDGTSLAANRRLARQQRRRRDRLLRRKRRVLEKLTQHGLFPVAEEARKALKSLDPYELRARGVRGTLTPHELGRAIFHLSQRRGFRSNRRTDRTADAAKEKGKVATGIAILQAQLSEAGAETLGELLCKRKAEGKGTRARRFGEGAKAAYEFYVDRAMVAHEFDLLWERQKPHQSDLLTDVARESIRDALFYQRPLKPVRPGKCSLEPSEERAPLALPTVQRFRIAQEVNNIRIRETPLSPERALTYEERRVLLSQLWAGKDFKFTSQRKKLGLPADAVINLESAKRDRIKGNVVAHVLGHDDAYGKAWFDMPIEEQDATVAMLLDDRLTDDEVRRRLSEGASLHPEQIERVLNAALPDGYGRVSVKAIHKLLPWLEDEVLTYDKAVRAAGYAQTDTDGDGSLPQLPYYGIALERHVAFGSGDIRDTDEKRYGRIANPSVHIALNELRKLVNAIIDRYGKPAEVVLELTRDIKLGWQKARDIEKEQAKKQQENEALREELRSLGQRPGAENLLRLRLFKELQRATGASTRCVYTGEQISQAQLFTNEIHIDHILPYSQTWDDSIANKVLCKSSANRDKANQSPHQAFGHSPLPYEWNAILQRAAALPRNRFWRFEADAMERFSDDDGFLARQLTDTAYMSRLAREYVRGVCPQVWVTTGKLTGLLRAKWGLNSLLSHDDLKNRLDHRHHAIDATVIACIDRAMVKRVADAAQRAAGVGRFLDDLDLPWPSFHAGLENAIARMVVSTRPDHNPRDALHNATAYGITRQSPAAAGIAVREVHSYVPVLALATDKPANVLEHIVDDRHGREIAGILESFGGDVTEIKRALSQYCSANRVHRVRWRENLKVIPIRNRADGDIYKYFKGDGNYCYELFVNEKGRWDGEIISTFVANQREYQSFMRDTERYRTTTSAGKMLVMRLRVGDHVAIEVSKNRLIYKVQKMSDGRIALAYHTASGDPFKNKRHIPGIDAAKSVAPSGLKALRGRQVFVDILGRVFDPGFADARPNSRDCPG